MDEDYARRMQIARDRKRANEEAHNGRLPTPGISIPMPPVKPPAEPYFPNPKIDNLDFSLTPDDITVDDAIELGLFAQQWAEKIRARKTPSR